MYSFFSLHFKIRIDGNMLGMIFKNGYIQHFANIKNKLDFLCSETIPTRHLVKLYITNYHLTKKALCFLKFKILFSPSELTKEARLLWGLQSFISYNAITTVIFTFKLVLS
ncbi:hypothetical protein KIL84_019884 [Mauremys mutica]|uniref:Uncharacterized protein n=1 Tax=Mauremys mutica TaxID=74926 RepID=A0A9D3XXS6_9SAUR|nr:hypothetical protein KIL84_019884 [Mauremys mutica]